MKSAQPGQLDLDTIAARVRAALEADHLDDAARALAGLRPADAADVIETLEAAERQQLLAFMDDPAAADILEEMDDEDAAAVAMILDPVQLAAILDEMESEEAADVLGDLSPDMAEGALYAMDDAAEAGVRSLMGYPDDTAGGRMSPDFLAVGADSTTGSVVSTFREIARGLSVGYYLYVVDEAGHLVGVVSLRDLLMADPTTRMQLIMSPDVIYVHVDDDQESAAQLMARYDLMALPVVGRTGELLGAIRHEDLVDVLLEEATEDMYRLVGVGTEERHYTPVRTSVRRRLPWLVANLGAQLVLVATLASFETTIAQVAALAVLFPVVTGQGGNVGAQTMTFVIRSLSLGELAHADMSRFVVKEVAVGLLMGLAVGALGGIIALVIGREDIAVILALAVWLAMVFNLAAGALSGAATPLVLHRFGIDPALASPMLVTTVTDTFGVILLIGLFRWLA